MVSLSLCFGRINVVIKSQNSAVKACGGAGAGLKGAKAGVSVMPSAIKIISLKAIKIN